LAAAADVITPTLTASNPSSGFNDLDMAVVISGTDFTAVMSGSVVITSPTAYLGNTALMDVTWVNSSSITATVPWGMDPGGYTLTVVNPDGGSGSLTNGYTVTQGIGQWNGGNLFGGTVLQILMKPGDPTTLYASALDVGMFRSIDAGESWKFLSGNIYGWADFVIDPYNPSRLYTVNDSGLCRSEDEGDTWSVMLNQWPDGRQLGDAELFISPHEAGHLFLTSAITPDGISKALGLLKSIDDGVSWSIIPDLEGISIRVLAFRPDNPLELVVGTSDGRVFRSTDGGDTWSEAAKPPIVDIGIITYNPFVSGEVWAAGAWLGGAIGVVKSNSDLTVWTDVAPTPTPSIHSIDFVSSNSVYLSSDWINYRSADDGVTWQPFGPPTGGYDLAWNPGDPNVMYMGGYRDGLYKTIDGGQTWEAKNQGLSALVTNRIEAPKDDRRRVYAVINGWNGVFVSFDSAASWKFIPVENSYNLRSVRVDPFNSQHIYLAADSGFYTSADGGKTWTPSIGARYSGSPDAFQPDPFQQGHLLVGTNISYVDPTKSALYTSSDFGQTWQEVTVDPNLFIVHEIAFDRLHEGVVYLTAGGSGLYRSRDHGATWERLAPDDPALQHTYSIAIATGPLPMVIVDAGNHLFRSLDGGDSWVEVGCPGDGRPIGGFQGMLLFVDGDSRRFYAATRFNLVLSIDGGDSCQPARGALGRLRTTALAYSGSGDQTILYAATTGGDVGGNNGMIVQTQQGSQVMEGNLLEAGIYRYVQRIKQTFIPFAMR
jgi:photosystem II stability/assembly factor-like uncharacterized protein